MVPRVGGCIQLPLPTPVFPFPYAYHRRRSSNKRKWKYKAKTKKWQQGERSKQVPLHLKGWKEDKINFSTSVLLYKNLPNKQFVPGIDDILKYVKNVT